MMTKFRVETKDNKFVVLDENDAAYGRYDSMKEANEAIEDWIAYYKED